MHGNLFDVIKGSDIKKSVEGIDALHELVKITRSKLQLCQAKCDIKGEMDQLVKEDQPFFDYVMSKIDIQDDQRTIKDFHDAVMDIISETLDDRSNWLKHNEVMTRIKNLLHAYRDDLCYDSLPWIDASKINEMKEKIKGSS